MNPCVCIVLTANVVRPTQKTVVVPAMLMRVTGVLTVFPVPAGEA